MTALITVDGSRRFHRNSAALDRPESNVPVSLLAPVLGLVLGLGSIGSVSAQAEGDSPTEVGSDLRLARKAENPVSDIIRVPIVNATLFGIGPNNQVGNALFIAPIVPILFRSDWSIVTRTSFPIVTVPNVAAGSGHTTGLGDITLEALGHKLFRIPKKRLFDLALGPIVGFPSATDQALGSGKYNLGPKLITGVTAKGVVALVLVRNFWSVGGDQSRADVNEFLLQYIFFYNFPKLWYLAMEPIITADWNAPRDNRWTVPVGAGVGKFFRIRRLPMTIRLQGFYNVVRPAFGAKWQLQFAWVFLNPNPLEVRRAP